MKHVGELAIISTLLKVAKKEPVSRNVRTYLTSVGLLSLTVVAHISRTHMSIIARIWQNCMQLNTEW